MRVKSIAVLGASLVLIPAAPASAGTLTTQNSCHFSLDQVWRHLPVDLSGTAAPSPVAPGSGVALRQASGRTVIPAYLMQYAANAGILNEGKNDIPTKVWAAIAAPDTPQGVQVINVDATATTTVTNGQASPMDVTIPLPDTTWTAGSTPVGFRQAGPGTLPRVAVGPGGSTLQPRGSIFIHARPGGGGVFINIDCQPGSGEGAEPPTPATAGAFETVQIDPGAPVVIPAPPTPAAKKPALTLRTSKLKRAGKRVSVALACADAPCAGTVTAKYAGGTAAKSVKYTLAAGASKTYKLTLSAKALKSLERKSLLVSVKITTDGGTTVSKKLRLKK
jgi:hypothetical protein